MLDFTGKSILARATALFFELDSMPMEARIETINAIRVALHKASPFQSEPVDCVLWVPADETQANDYNPNTVAPPEMKLLEHSIREDGFTQPVVTWQENGTREVIDGFHRNRVGKESHAVRKRTHGYLPVVTANETRTDRSDRIAATIRHNRARGKHRVEAMSDIVVELKRRNWTDERIARELGMDKDEILRLCQITGLAELFSDQQFSKSWDIEGEITQADLEQLSEDVSTYGQQAELFRTVNTDDPTRIFHTFDKWECHKAGFYESFREGMTKEQCEESFRSLLASPARFSEALQGVVTEWKHSCEHYLTNKAMNRIAWLGQAAVCYATGVPATFRSGFALLTEKQQKKANATALKYLNKWMAANDRDPLTMEEAVSGDRQSDIY